MIIFGKNLKELRTAKKISQTKLGEIFSLSQDTISLYEKGTAEPCQDVLINIAKFFDVTVDYLLGNDIIKK